MDHKIELAPRDHEVRQQLNRILESDTFSTWLKPAAILRFVVEKALKGESATEKDILAALFPPEDYAPGTNVARVNAKYMRVRLPLYYKTLGRDDPVIIQFPASPKKGKRVANYRPTFSYHPDHRAAIQYQGARYHMNRPRQPDGLMRALVIFLHMIGVLPVKFDNEEERIERPSHLDGYFGYAECRFALHVLRSSASDIDWIDSCVQEAVKREPNDWRTHAISALLAMAQCDIGTAATSFENALAASRSDVLKYGWYHAFLFAMGRSAEALDLVATLVAENPTDPTANAVYGLWLYGLRQFGQAQQYFDRALDLAENCSLARLGQALTFIANVGAAYAVQHLEALEQPSESYHWNVSGLKVYCALVLASWDDVTRDRILESVGRRLDEEDNPKPTVEEYEPFVNFQYAISDLGYGRETEAITWLEYSWRDRDPLIMWLHMMPVFDRLLEHDGFRSLLGRRLEAPPLTDDPSV
jgi:tetratricopeptide (TPR) repeat protein